MRSHPPLDDVEHLVLARIRAHRAQQRHPRPLPIAVPLAVCALAAVVGVCLSRITLPRHSPDSEAVVLADDVALAPSTLLTKAL